MANSFIQLMEEEYEPRFMLPNNNGFSDFELIEQRIKEQRLNQHFNSDVADLFLPRMVRTIIGIFGGELANDSDSFDRPAPSDYITPLITRTPKSPGER